MQKNLHTVKKIEDDPRSETKENRRMRRWTIEEVITLEKMVAEGATNLQIGQALGRTEKAVDVKKWKLSIKHDPDEYEVMSPSGERHTEVENLNNFVRQNAKTVPEFREQSGRIPRAFMGLQWALRTGREWKGWGVRRTKEGTRNRRRNPQ